MMLQHPYFQDYPNYWQGLQIESVSRILVLLVHLVVILRVFVLISFGYIR